MITRKKNEFSHVLKPTLVWNWIKSGIRRYNIMTAENKESSSRRRTPHRSLIETTDFESDSFPHVPLSGGNISNYRQDEDDATRPEDAALGLKGDRSSVAILLFLYVLQGIPLGLAGSIPMILQSRKISYKEQAVFSFVYWPFSIKLLWAPIVDALFVSRFGRRKSWLVPTQYLIGLFMLVLSGYIPSLLGDSDESTGTVNVLTLTGVFFCLNFLAATQDIAVDGWALTMLSRRNIGWASTCNTVGQTAGYFLGNVLFLALESADFCNNYLRSEPQTEGLVTLAGFLYFWGIVFLVTTTLVCFLKREEADPDADPEAGILSTYLQLWDVIRLRSVMSYALIILTGKIGFAAADSLTGLKLIERGLPKERLALFAVPMVPVQIALPLIISKYTTGPNPMSIWLKAFPCRLALGLLYLFCVWWTAQVQTEPGVFPWYYYTFVLFSYALHQVAVYCMFVSQMAFHAKVSDPAIGGTYMTLLNTMANLGGNWPGTIALWFVDSLTSKQCEGGPGDCDSPGGNKLCEKGGGNCATSLDGYYVESVVCIVLGVLWYLWRRRRLQQLDNLSLSHWQASR